MEFERKAWLGSKKVKRLELSVTCTKEAVDERPDFKKKIGSRILPLTSAERKVAVACFYFITVINNDNEHPNNHIFQSQNKNRESNYI